jgi:hypothetical protein
MSISGVTGQNYWYKVDQAWNQSRQAISQQFLDQSSLLNSALSDAMSNQISGMATLRASRAQAHPRLDGHRQRRDKQHHRDLRKQQRGRQQQQFRVPIRADLRGQHPKQREHRQLFCLARMPLRVTDRDFALSLYFIT